MRLNKLVLIALALLIPSVVYAQGYPWCSSMDEVTAQVDGSSLTLHHQWAAYNCCPDSFRYEVALTGDSLLVVENEVLTNPCACECCYKLSTSVENLPPGQLHVVFRWADDDPSVWRDWHLSVTIGDSGQTGELLPGPSRQSNCIEHVPVSSMRWGVLKSSYQ